MIMNFLNNFDLLCIIGFYPYDWVNDITKLDHIGLPLTYVSDSSFNQDRIAYDDSMKNLNRNNYY